MTLSISNKSGNRETPFTLVGKGFRNGTTVTLYIDRTRDSDGQIINMPDGVWTPGTDVDLESAGVGSGGTFTVNNAARVPPFAPTGANQINAIDDENPPNHYNGMGGQPPVTFTIEPLLYVSSSLVALGGKVELTLVDWPATDQVMDHVTADAQGVDRVVRSAVTIAGIPQEIISGEGPVGPDNEHTFLVRVGDTVPAGVHQLKVKTYTAGQMMSDVPEGASDTKEIEIRDRFCPLDTAWTPGSVAGDRAALVALYNATDGANWTDNTNWLTNVPLGQWHGVSADAEGRVCALNLHSNGLSGGIPEELGNLTSLAVLHLHNNQISGEIPAELGNLLNLRSLELMGNRLSGEIPAELGNLTSLARLYLGYNQLSGEIPAELGNLVNLRSLQLMGNRLSGEIPPELGNLTSLAVLHLYYNQLSGEIPPELGNLLNLRSLELMGNRLSGEIPAELGNLTSLVVLHLHNNQISGEIPAELGNLTSLTHVDLSENPISGEIPAELGNLTSLNSLRFKGNQLSGEIPAELGRLKSLEALFLSHNRLSGDIPKELGNLTNLAGLFLNDNQLSGDIPKELGNLTNLAYMYLNSNRLTGCVPARLRSIEGNDLAELELLFCDMLDGRPVAVIRFLSPAGAPVRLGSPVSLEATFSEPVSGFVLEDVSAVNSVAGNFAGSGAVYTFDVTPNAIGEVTVDIAAGVAEDADGSGNLASSLPLGIPYDDDGDGDISRDEVISAIKDYIDEIITREQVIAVITLYLSV